jgi:Holliday junction resolvasome RuvABC endonuclease subunit
VKPLTESSILAGVDYSICSPAVAVGPASDLSFESCQFLVVNDKKPKNLSKFKNVEIIPHPAYEFDIQRFHDNANLILQFCIHHKAEYFFIEDYAMGARGRIFNIGENGGILKHQLWIHNFPFQTYPPTVIKKFATGKGNAKKDAMWEQFVEDTGEESLYQALIGTNKLDSPVTDIVDAWYILRYGKSITFAPKVP